MYCKYIFFKCIFDHPLRNTEKSGNNGNVTQSAADIVTQVFFPFNSQLAISPIGFGC